MNITISSVTEVATIMGVKKYDRWRRHGWVRHDRKLVAASFRDGGYGMEKHAPTKVIQRDEGVRGVFIKMS